MDYSSDGIAIKLLIKRKKRRNMKSNSCRNKPESIKMKDCDLQKLYKNTCTNERNNCTIILNVIEIQYGVALSLN